MIDSVMIVGAVIFFVFGLGFLLGMLGGEVAENGRQRLLARDIKREAIRGRAYQRVHRHEEIYRRR